MHTRKMPWTGYIDSAIAAEHRAALMSARSPNGFYQEVRERGIPRGSWEVLPGCSDSHRSATDRDLKERGYIAIELQSDR